MSEESYIRIEMINVRIRDYMEDVEIMVSSPESYKILEGIPASSNVNYQHVYVSLSP